MQVFITVNTDKALRITDGNGAFLTFGTNGETSQVLSVCVPEDKRCLGTARNLLLASEKVLSHKGIERIYADFYDGIEGTLELFQGIGYEKEPDADILSLPMGMVLYAPNVKNSLELKSRYSNYRALSELTVTQMDELFELFSEIGLPVNGYDLAHYNTDTSIVVYNKSNKPVCVILCSDLGRDLHVNFLASKAGVDPTYNLVAMLGMAEALKKHGGENRYNALTMAAYNKNVIDLIERILPEYTGLKVVGKCITVSKSIKDGYADASDYEYLKDRDDYQEFNWKREIRKIPYQKNIILKAQWQRVKDS